MSSSSVRSLQVAARPAGPVGVAVLVWGLLLAVLTFARWPALSWSVGATCLGSVYQAVNAVPTALFDIAAGCALASVAVPVLVGALGHGRPRDVARLGSAVLTWTVLVLGLVSVAVALAAPLLAGALVGGSGCVGAVDVAADMLRWVAPQPLLLGAAIVLGAILRAHGHVRAATVGPALASLVVVGSLVWFRLLAAASDATGVPGSHLAVLAGGTTLGAAVLAAVPAVVAWRSGLGLRPTLRVPMTLAAETRGVALACGLAVFGQLFAVVAAVVVASRSGVGVLPVYAYVQGVLLVPYAALLVPLLTVAVPRLAGVPTVTPPRRQDPEETTVLTRSARHRKVPTIGTLAWLARMAVAAGAVGAAGLAAAAGPLGGFFLGIDAARVTTQGRAALEAVTVGLWAAAGSLILLGVAGVLCAALYVRGRPFVAGGAVAAAWLIAGAVPLVAVMPGGTPTWTLEVLGVAAVAGLSVATLDLLAATSRAWGRGALAGLGRTFVVGVLGAAAAAAVGVAADRWWPLEGVWANAAAAVGLGAVGALLTVGLFAGLDRGLTHGLARRLRQGGEPPTGVPAD